jgi:hypothetical protein
MYRRGGLAAPAEERHGLLEGVVIGHEGLDDFWLSIYPVLRYPIGASGTDREQIPRIFHGSKRHLRVPFRCELPNAVRRQREKCLTIQDFWKLTAVEKRCGRPLGEGRPRANPVWGRGGVGT